MNQRVLRVALYTVAGVLLAGAAVGFRLHADSRFAAEARAASEAATKLAAARAAAPHDEHLEALVSDGSTWSELLLDMDFDPQAVYNATQAARAVYNLRRLRPGTKLLALKSPSGELRSLDYQIDPERELLVKQDGGQYKAEIRQTPGTVKTVAVSGQVQGSLFDGVVAAGEHPELALRLADIFAWDMDFNTDTQPNDTFRLVMEKKEYKDGSPSSYGRILAAEYDNAGQVYKAVLFHDAQGVPGYYSADGKSLQKAFLRSPLKFAARISSHFSLHRLHPILKIRRPHLGTDYAAPTGTPVQAIASGQVIAAARKGGNGIYVCLRHSNGYETYYMHLSRALVHAGQHVNQGQRIGLVGMTGLATGPHLDFRLQKNGRFVDFERLKLPPAFPVAKADMGDFIAERDHWMALLPPLNVHNAAVPEGQPAPQAKAGGSS